MVKEYQQETVLEASLDRFIYLFQNGHVCVSFSGGKDSTVCIELAVMAAQSLGIPQVDVVYRDEEVVSPETTAFAMRMAARPEIRFHWCVANQPIINIFDRNVPYVWTYDPLLEPEQWMQLPPDIAQIIPDMNIERLITKERLGVPEDETLFVVVGIRTSESLRRKFAINSSKGYLTKKINGISKARPIYDWEDDDIWKFLKDYQCDYNRDYDVMWRLGIPKRSLRIAPLTMNTAGIGQLQAMAKAYPKWFDKLCVRCKGVRAASNFGKAACEPIRRAGETWEDCFNRTCITEAPEWIRKRAQVLMQKWTASQAKITTDPLPQKGGHNFKGMSWEKLTKIMYNGDPFCMKTGELTYVEPHEFRPGGGSWHGKPTW
jgi:predicted phosphoadenosine phosphosulfate sulfurtransferase